MAQHSRCMASLFALAWLVPPGCVAQFGAGGGYDPPAPVCKKFSCPKGEKPAGNPKHKLWSYGCADSGMNFLNMASFDPSNPMGGMKNQGKNVDKCCVERDICKQTCGTTATQCHNEFQKCQKKICKGDQNCALSAMMSDMKSDTTSDEEKAQDDKERKEQEDSGEKFDYDKDRKRKDCRGYEKHQNLSCQCVPEKEWQSVTDSNLKAFYKTHNPEKLDSSGEIKDIDDVWKKWKGKEADMFIALATKYKKKAVKIKKAPSPPPYTPPPPLSPEEQEKEDIRSEENKKKWAKEDAEYAEKNKERDAKKAKEDEERAEERRERDAEEAKRKEEEEEGEEVEL